jgi:hypothetical protein
MQALLGLHFSMGNESFCFLEDCMSYSVLALGFSFSLVKRKMGRKKIRVLQADFKLVSIIGVPNRT